MTQPINQSHMIRSYQDIQSLSQDQQAGISEVENFDQRCEETLQKLIRKVTQQHYKIKSNYNKESGNSRYSHGSGSPKVEQESLLFQFQLPYGKYDRVQISRTVQDLGGRVIFDWIAGCIVVVDDQIMSELTSYKQQIALLSQQNFQSQSVTHALTIQNSLQNTQSSHRRLFNLQSFNDGQVITQSSIQNNSLHARTEASFAQGSQDQNKGNFKLNRRQQKLLQNCATKITPNQFQRNLGSDEIGQIQIHNFDHQYFEQAAKVLEQENKTVIRYKDFKILKRYIKSWSVNWFVNKDVTGRIRHEIQDRLPISLFALANLDKKNRSNYEIIMEEFDQLTIKKGNNLVDHQQQSKMQKIVDVPKYRPDAPLGTSIFQTQTQYKESLEQYSEIQRKYINHVTNHKYSSQETVVQRDQLNEFLEPEPIKQFCDACSGPYQSYHTHISTVQHKYKMSQLNQSYYNDIDHLFDNLKRERAKNNFDFLFKEAQAHQAFLLNAKKKLSPMKVEVSLGFSSIKNKGSGASTQRKFPLEISSYMKPDIKRHRFSPINNNDKLNGQKSPSNQENQQVFQKLAESKENITTPQNSTKNSEQPPRQSFLTLLSGQKNKQGSSVVSHFNSIQSIKQNITPELANENSGVPFFSLQAKDQQNFFSYAKEKYYNENEKNQEFINKFQHSKLPMRRKQLLLGNNLGVKRLHSEIQEQDSSSESEQEQQSEKNSKKQPYNIEGSVSSFKIDFNDQDEISQYKSLYSQSSNRNEIDEEDRSSNQTSEDEEFNQEEQDRISLLRESFQAQSQSYQANRSSSDNKTVSENRQRTDRTSSHNDNVSNVNNSQQIQDSLQGVIPQDVRSLQSYSYSCHYGNIYSYF
eukprot:403367970